MIRLSPSSSVDTSPPFPHYSLSSFTSTLFFFTMSDIYTHEPVMDFTNPFLDFNQGYIHPLATILPTVRATLVPIVSEEESVLLRSPSLGRNSRLVGVILGVRVRGNLQVRFFFLLS